MLLIFGLSFLKAVSAIATLASGFGSITAGISANKASRREARALEEQGLIARQEEEAEAARVKREGDRLRARQRVAFTASGVSLAGSPAILDLEQAEDINKRVKARRARGRNIQSLRRTQAKTVRGRGKSALFGGFGKGLSRLSTLLK